MSTALENLNKQNKQEVDSLLLPNEELLNLYSAVMDYVAITDKRLLFVDGEFASSKKTITSLPFKSIVSVHLEKGGFLSFTKKVIVAVSGGKFNISLISRSEAKDLYNNLVLRVL